MKAEPGWSSSGRRWRDRWRDRWEPSRKRDGTRMWMRVLGTMPRRSTSNFAQEKASSAHRHRSPVQPSCSLFLWLSLGAPPHPGPWQESLYYSQTRYHSSESVHVGKITSSRGHVLGLAHKSKAQILDSGSASSCFKDWQRASKNGVQGRFSLTLAMTERWPKPGSPRQAKQPIWEPGVRDPRLQRREPSGCRTWGGRCMGVLSAGMRRVRG